MDFSRNELLAAANIASSLLKALAHPYRLMIACRLFETAQSVGQLAKSLEIRDSTVSQHLASLRREGIVSARRDGHLVWYSIESEVGLAVIQTICDHHCKKPRRAIAKARKSRSTARS